MMASGAAIAMARMSDDMASETLARMSAKVKNAPALAAKPIMK